LSDRGGPALGISVVVPAHNEADCIGQLVARLRSTLDGIGRPWEVVVVDDGSTDATWSQVQTEAAGDERVRGIRLARSFGHQAALTAGLGAARGELIVTMDGDLQHPPEVIPSLIEQSEEGFDVVYAVRSGEDSESRMKVWSASLFYWLINRLTRLDLPPGAGDFRAMSRRVVDVLLGMPERNRFLRGMTRWVGFTQTSVSYKRAERAGGRTKYSFWRMLSFAFDAITGFSSFPLRVASLVGIFVAFLGALYLGYVLAYLAFSGRAVPGWSSVLATILVLGGVQLVCFGLMGEYVGRMYNETKGRPMFLIWEVTGPTDVSGPGDSEPVASANVIHERESDHAASAAKGELGGGAERQ
jgi:polyisoprenyl-phosphate glycosyltransferase